MQALPRPLPVYVIGDSHSMIYNDRQYSLSGEPARSVALRSMYCREVMASTCVTPGGPLAPTLLRVLGEARLIVETERGLEAFHRTADPRWRHVAVAEDRHRADPPLVLAFGGLDVFHLGGRLAAARIRIPRHLRGDAPAALYDVPPGSMPFAEAVQVCGAFVQPLAQLVDRLQGLGFARIALLSVPPATANDDAFARAVANVDLSWGPAKLQTPFRYQLLRVVNETLRSIAAAAGAAFVDRWPAQVQNGLALPWLLHDWLHVGSAAADETARALVRHFFVERGTVSAGATAA